MLLDIFVAKSVLAGEVAQHHQGTDDQDDQGCGQGCLRPGFAVQGYDPCPLLGLYHQQMAQVPVECGIQRGHIPETLAQHVGCNRGFENLADLRSRFHAGPAVHDIRQQPRLILFVLFVHGLVR